MIWRFVLAWLSIGGVVTVVRLSLMDRPTRIKVRQETYRLSVTGGPLLATLMAGVTALRLIINWPRTVPALAEDIRRHWGR